MAIFAVSITHSLTSFAHLRVPSLVVSSLSPPPIISFLYLENQQSSSMRMADPHQSHWVRRNHHHPNSIIIHVLVLSCCNLTILDHWLDCRRGNYNYLQIVHENIIFHYIIYCLGIKSSLHYKLLWYKIVHMFLHEYYTAIDGYNRAFNPFHEHNQIFLFAKSRSMDYYCCLISENIWDTNINI